MATIHQDVPRCVRAEIRYMCGGNNASNVLHVGTDADPTPADLQDIRSVIQSWLLADWQDLVSSEVTAVELVLTDLSDIHGSRLVEQLNIPGVDAGQALPSNATIAIKADIGTRGKGKNGRVFQFGIPEGSVDNNTMLPASVTAFCALWNGLNDLLQAAPGIVGLVVPHFVVDKVRPLVVEWDPVISFVCSNPYMDSQKNRLPFHKKKKKQITPPTP